MKNLTFRTEITVEQLYSLLSQLGDQDKLMISNRLRAEVAGRKWETLSERIPTETDLSSKDILDAVKSVRKGRESSK